MNQLLAQRRQALARLGRGRFWAVTNSTGPVAEIRIYDEIWLFGVNADDFARDLEAIDAPEIVVAINSPGGDVFDAIAIYNTLRNHPARITTRVDGIAASAASVIVQAGDRRVMMSGAQMMIHEPWGVAIGPASEMRAFAELLDQQTEVLASIYASRSGKDVEDFRAQLAGGKDVWLSDQATLDEGLADEISDPAPNASVEPQNKTLNDEIRAAVDAAGSVISSAERVAALRAEKGKTLSEINRDSLDELTGVLERARALLDRSDIPDDSDDAAREYARFVALNQ